MNFIFHSANGYLSQQSVCLLWAVQFKNLLHPYPDHTDIHTCRHPTSTDGCKLIVTLSLLSYSQIFVRLSMLEGWVFVAVNQLLNNFIKSVVLANLNIWALVWVCHVLFCFWILTEEEEEGGVNMNGDDVAPSVDIFNPVVSINFFSLFTHFSISCKAFPLQKNDYHYQNLYALPLFCILREGC